MTFWQAFKATYSGSVAVLIACPLLALVPVVFELLQHAVEVHIGMYDSIATAKATEHHPLRMAFGMLKVAALTIPFYWVTRFQPDRDATFAARPDPKAIRLFAVYCMFQLGLAALQLFGLPQTGAVLAVSFVVGMIVGNLLLAWGVAAALGNATVGPRRSIAIMARHVPWTFAFSIAVILPLVIPHYAAAALAIAGPKVLLWPVLIADSLLVGWLTAAMAAGGYYAAVRAASKAGVDLMPGNVRRADLSDGMIAAAH
ncbi:MAG: hypothetical protein DI640_10845 [Sphingomonas taxi]|uniref:Uncharacterized protein n=1 Tax=Sphingomonas taxi TaxID=1549858 RepID=A0A2W4YXJ0_9SPHN|nr:MAG: hypothetical protein DI640_10845 [Sphingomonas taxi]